MTATAFFVTLALVQGTFVALDLADRHATRHERGERALPVPALLFFIGVLLLFLLVQIAGMSLVPRADALIDVIRTHVGGAIPARAAPGGWALLLAWVALFYLTGFFDYAWHRWFSHHRWFWFTHENHHLPSQVFVGMPGLAARPFVVLTVVPVLVATTAASYAALRLLGLPMWDWTVFQLPLLLSSTVLTASHSSFLRRGWLAHDLMRRLALTTPQEHVLHHTVDLEGNYGNITTLWDRLLGTYVDPKRAENQGHRLGLAYDQDFLGTLTFGLVKLPVSWRQRYEVHRYCNIDSGGGGDAPPPDASRLADRTAGRPTRHRTRYT